MNRAAPFRFAFLSAFPVTDTAEALDSLLGRTVVNFVGAHLQLLKNTLERAKAEMDAAAKAAQAEARTKAKTQAKKDGPQPTAGKPKEDAKQAEPVKPAAPRTASLFDMPVPEPPPLPVVAAAAPESSEEDDLLDELRENEDDEPEAQLGEAA